MRHSLWHIHFSRSWHISSCRRCFSSNCKNLAVEKRQVSGSSICARIVARHAVMCRPFDTADCVRVFNGLVYRHAVQVISYMSVIGTLVIGEIKLWAPKQCVLDSRQICATGTSTSRYKRPETRPITCITYSHFIKIWCYKTCCRQGIRETTDRCCKWLQEWSHIHAPNGQ